MVLLACKLHLRVHKKYMVMTLMVHVFRSLEQNDIYCVGFQNGALQSKDGKDIVLMGGSTPPRRHVLVSVRGHRLRNFVAGEVAPPWRRS